MYTLYKFHFLNGISEINQLFDDILIIWPAPVYVCVCVCGGGHINIFSGGPQSSIYGPAHEGPLNRGRIDGLTSHRCDDSWSS